MAASFAARALASRENGNREAFVFPSFEANTRLKGWKFGLTKKSQKPMFTLEFKVVDGINIVDESNLGGKHLAPEDLQGKTISEHIVIDQALSWRFDNFLRYLSDSGIDLEQINEDDPEYRDIQKVLDFLEDNGQHVKLSVAPQESNPRYYRIKFLEVQKIVKDEAKPAAKAEPVEEKQEAIGLGAENAEASLVAQVHAKVFNSEVSHVRKPWDK